MADIDEPQKPGVPVPQNDPQNRTPVQPDTEDPETDAAVDDIVKKESDDTLASQDAATQKAVVMKESKWERFKDAWAAWWDNPKKRWGTIAAVVVILAVLFAVPVTRWNILGVALKAPVTVRVVDSKSGAPVSGATVELSGKTAETEADGKATLRVNTGSGSLKVSKKYYSTSTESKLVALSGNTFKATLSAEGHQVNVKVVDKVSGKPVANAEITAGGAQAKTDTNGTATLVIAGGSGSQKANVSLGGYNTAHVTVTADGNLAKNTFALIPAGKVYYVDDENSIVGANLDGTGKEVIYSNGTRGTTVLSVSPDSKYLAYFVDGSDPNVINLVDTTNNNKVTTVDSVTGESSFQFDGWSGDTLVYDETAPSAYQLKSVDATSRQPLLLDKIATSDTESRLFSDVYVFGNQVVYVKSWTMNTTGDDSKHDELDTIKADGSGHAVIQTFNVAYNQGQPHLMTAQCVPGSLYIYDGSAYYTYANGKVTASNISQTEFSNAGNASFVVSPAGDKVLWMNSQKVLVVSNADGSGQKQLDLSANYAPYGWIGENYLVLDNDGSLYVTPVSGGKPYKIPNAAYR